MTELKWDYSGDFLTQFETKWRGTIGDQICRIIRSGEQDNGRIRVLMREKCIDKALDGSNAEFYDQLYNALILQEAEEFVDFLVWRENLSPDEKQKLKAESQENSKNNFMANQPPTLPQLNYLVSLGCYDTPKNKLEASEWISVWKNKIS